MEMVIGTLFCLCLILVGHWIIVRYNRWSEFRWRQIDGTPQQIDLVPIIGGHRNPVLKELAGPWSEAITFQTKQGG